MIEKRDPRQIRQALLKGEGFITADDIEVVIDTFPDRRKARYVFDRP